MAELLDRLEELLAQQEARIAKAFRDFIRVMNSDAVTAQVVDLLERGDVPGALKIVDSYVARFASVLPSIQATVGAAAAEELAELASEFIVGISFNPSNPRAAAFAEANRLTLIREFGAEQRRATRQAIARAFQEGTSGPVATARAFRESIGLTSGQERWVANFRAGLENLDRRVLSRALRDRRFDPTVERALRTRRPLTSAQIDRMVERYHARALMLRSETIARTEALRATAQARQEALNQMVEQIGIDPRRVSRVWNATRDERTRDWHSSMQGQQVGLREKFTDGNGNELLWPGDPSAPPETTINCRCVVTFEIKPALQDSEAGRYSTR